MAERTWVEWLTGRTPRAPKIQRLPESEMAGGHRGVAMGSFAAPDRSAENVEQWQQLTGHEVENFLYAGIKLRMHSSNVAWASYNPHSNQLHVGFKDGSEYQYDQISPREAVSFAQAYSKGTWVHDRLIGRGNSGKKGRGIKPFRKLR